MKQAVGVVREEDKKPDIGLRSLEHPETYSPELQKKIIDRATHTPGEILFDALPEELKAVSFLLTPPLLIPSKEFLIKNPLATINFFNSLKKYIPTDSLTEDTKQVLSAYKQFSLHIATLSQECRKGRNSLDKSCNNSRLVSLDQSAKTIALIAPVLRGVFQTIPIPEVLHALPAPKRIEGHTEGKVLEDAPPIDKSSMADLLKALFEEDILLEPIADQKQKNKIAQIQKSLSKRRSRSVLKRDRLADAWNGLPKSVKVAGGIFGSAAILGWAAANDCLPVVIGAMATLGLVGIGSELIQSRERTEADEGKEGDVPSNLPRQRSTAFASQKGGPFSMGSERSKNQTLPEPKSNSKQSTPQHRESTGKSTAQDGARIPLGEHARRRDVDINSSASNLHSAGLIGEMERGELCTGSFRTADDKFTSVMCVAEPYIVIGANGKMESVRGWRDALPLELREEFQKGLFISKSFKSSILEDTLDEGETELEFEFAVTEASLPTPANYQIIALAVVDKEGALVEGDFEVEMCVLGSALLKLPRPGLTVKYKLAEVSYWELKSDSVDKLIPKISIQAGFTVDSMIDALNSVHSTSAEKAVLWFEWLVENDFRYSNDFFVGNLLRRSGDNLSEALLGLRIATCDPMAFVTAASLGNLSIPSFVTGGLVPKLRKDGTFSFGGDSGHAQAAALLDSRVYTFDLTSEASKVSYDPLLIPAAERSLLLSRISRGSGEGSYIAGADSRAILLKLKNKTEKGFRGFSMRIERRFRNMLGGETVPGIPEIPASGHNFKNRLPNVSDSRKKIGALNFVGYFNQLSNLCKEGVKGKNIFAPLSFYEKAPNPPVVGGMEEFLPEKFQKIASEAKFAAQKIIFDYVESLLKESSLFDGSNQDVCKWMLGFLSNGRKDFRLTYLPNYVSHLSISELCALHHQFSPYIDNIDYKKFTFFILQDLLVRNRTSLESVPTFSFFQTEDREGIKYLINTLGDDFEERNLKLSIEERKQLTLLMAWLGKALDYLSQEKEMHKVLTSKAIRSFSGRGETSAKVFMTALQDKNQGFREEFERFLKDVGVSASFDFMSDSQLKKKIELELGQRLVADLQKLELSLENIYQWKRNIKKFNEFGLVPDLSSSKKALFSDIAKTSEALSKRGLYFNYPTEETPGSFLMASLTNRGCALLVDALQFLQRNSKGVAEQEIRASWLQVDEYKVTAEFFSLAIFKESGNDVILSLSGCEPLNNNRLVISDNPRLVRQFFVQFDGSGFLQRIDPLGAYLIERLNFAPKTDKLTKVFHSIEQKYPTLWGAVEYDNEVENKLPYIFHTHEALRSLLVALLPHSGYRSEVYSGFIWYIENRIFKNQHEDVDAQIEDLKVFLFSDVSAQDMPFGFTISKEAFEAGALIAIIMEKYSNSFLREWIQKEFGFDNALFCWRRWSPDMTMGQAWNRMLTQDSPLDSESNYCMMVSEQLSSMQQEVDWIYSRVASPYSQFLYSHTGHVVISSQGGDFDEFRPYSEGDDLRRVDWLNSARSPTLQVKKYTEDEVRHTNLIYDAKFLWKAFASDDSSAEKIISDMIMHFEIAYRENLKIDLIIQGRATLLHFVDIQAPHNSDDSGPFFRTREFWSQLFTSIDSTNGVYATEQNLFGDDGIGYDIFCHEQPNLAPGRLNYFVLDKENLDQSNEYLDSLKMHGEIVEIDSQCLE